MSGRARTQVDRSDARRTLIENIVLCVHDDTRSNHDVPQRLAAETETK